MSRNRNAFSAGLMLAGAGLALAAAVPLQAHSLTEVPAEDFDYKGWDAYLGGGESSQYSSLDQINKENVDELEVAWTYETEGGNFAPLFNPVVVGNRMFVLAGNNTLAALDAATGEEIWRHVNEGRIGTRGINYWEDEDGTGGRLLFLANGYLQAVDTETGQQIMDFGTEGKVDLREGLDPGNTPERPLMTNNPGRIFEDLIIMSLPAGAYDFPSSSADIHAYNVKTGERVWEFHMVPREGEFGYDTWPAQDHNKFGGVHNWSESTVDTELGIVFIPTGTARYDFYGGNREGDNLYGNSVVAIDARTGERLWHYQTVHHDLWDFDIPSAPKLMTITKDGEQIPILIQPTKQGLLFAFDRRTGEPVWPIEERPVPASDVPGEKVSPTQPFPTWPEPYGRYSFTEDDINPLLPEEDQAKLREGMKTWRWEGLYTPPSLQGTISMPGHNGGSNWGNAAIDPENQRFYVVARHFPVNIKLIPDQREAALEAMPNSDDPDVIPYRSPVDFMFQSNGMFPVKPPFSTLTAYDMNSGNKLWSIPNGEILTLEEKGITGVGSQAPRGGPVVTGGGVIFVGTATDRAFRARDAETGEVLWEHRFDAATEGVPAVYEVNGRQYVTVPVGGMGHFAFNLGLPEAGKSRYVTFALPQE